EISGLCGRCDSDIGAGHWRKHSYFQLGRRGNAAVVAGRESFAVGPTSVEGAQSAKLSRLHEFGRLPHEPEAWRCESLGVLVLRTDVSRNSAGKCLFGDRGLRQLW